MKYILFISIRITITILIAILTTIIYNLLIKLIPLPPTTILAVIILYEIQDFIRTSLKAIFKVRA